MSLPASQLQEVHERFAAFLKERGQRRTPERFAVLDALYDTPDHVDADTLYLRLRNDNIHVSRATVYNTLDLLLESDLAARHQWGQNQAKYERAWAYWQHDHLICLDCGEVLEFCDPRLQQIQETVADIYDFEVARHALTIYGHCGRERCPSREAKEKAEATS